MGRLTVRQPPVELLAAIEALAAGPISEDTLAERAGDHAARLFYHLESAADLGLLRWTVTHEGQHLLSASPVSPYFVRQRKWVDDDMPYQLSRFAHLRVEGAGMVLECPLSHVRLTLHDRRVAALLCELAQPLSPRDAAGRVEGLDAEAIRAVFQLLSDGAMLAFPPEGVQTPEENALEQWEFHDLVFHARSSGLRHGQQRGGTYRFKGQLPSPPAVKPPMSATAVELFRPDLEALRQGDVPFTEVLERRRSIRGRGPTPVTAQQLGEFLFRSARIRQLRPSPEGELSERPYPGAGARYELEIYPVVNVCEGIPAGLYHYCPLRHALEPLSGLTDEVSALLAPVRSPQPPDVLCVIAARFQRIAWKYEATAYALMLQDVGALLQTMYLVATAMTLSPYAVGNADSDLFCRAVGTDYRAEGSVGGFALSGAPP
jgi:SagB-type dehydrogenase family enzyme